jgi:hypothetical protein
MSKYTYNSEEVFQDDPDDPESVLLTIPEDICKEIGWEPGDNIHIEVFEGSIRLRKL